MSVGWSRNRRGSKSGAVAVCGIAILLLFGPRAARPDSASDDLVKQRITIRLLGQVTLHVESLQIEVADGVALLSGTAASLGEVRTLTRIVGGVVGVNAVTNNVTVRSSGRTSDDIQQEIRRNLERRARFQASPIAVKVTGGDVTLEGKADRGLDRLDAEMIAASVAGVTRIVNRIEVIGSESTSPEEIRKRVLSILTNPLTFGLIRGLEVAVEGGTVTLRGITQRETQREEAERLALGVPGVAHVDNQITVLGS